MIKNSFPGLLLHELRKRFKYKIIRIFKNKIIVGESKLLADGMKHFSVGDLEGAIGCYQKIKVDPYYSQVACKMLGWIAYSKGRLDEGWPFYPVTSIDRVHFMEFLAAYVKYISSDAIRIRKAARPWELKYLLKLKEWSPQCQPKIGTLVWFNFGSSLGGEILCGKLLGSYIESYKEQRVVCAVDARLKMLFQATFPAVEFISKKEMLPLYNKKYDYYLLGRDMLKLIVNTEQDYLKLKSKHMLPSAEPLVWNAGSKMFKVAISWKTTNLEQGVYRNIPLPLLVRVLQKYPFKYFLAQHGMTEEERTYLAQELGEHIDFDFLNPSGSIYDFSLKLKGMDLILSIDNSTMHIAGCLGVKTYALLSVPSYWAFPENGQESRWYGNLEIIRQKIPGDWESVVNELDTKLTNMRNVPTMNELKNI